MPTRFGSTSGLDLQVLAARDHVLILAVALAAGLGRRAEGSSVADAAAVVNRHHDVALAGQPLIDAVGPVIELHVVIGGHHLPHRSAVHENDRRPPLAGFQVLRQEELIVDLHAVSGLGDDDLRLHVRVHRKAGPGRGEDDFLRAAAIRVPIFHTPSDCGMFQSALSVARYLPEASGAGDVSTPSLVVICTGVPPPAGTAQMWRRSISLALVQ